MRSFDYSELKDRRWSTDLLGTVGAIQRATGRQELFLKQHPEELEKLVAIAKVQSTEASNAIEGIVTTDERIRQLMDLKTAPRNRSEKEIAGYRDVLSVIHESFDDIEISQRYILQLHRMLLEHTGSAMAGKTKNVQNYVTAVHPDGRRETLFTPLDPFETPIALDAICASYNRVIGEGTIDPLLVIPAFIHDFLCIHPFNDGNGRMSRLLTTLLLYRSRYYVARYVSLEAKILRTKNQYYQALADSGKGWHAGAEDATPFTSYLLVTILSACRDFEDRYELVKEKRPALEIVRDATRMRVGRFTKQDIREICPFLSSSAIEKALRILVSEGEIAREGAGRSTAYRCLK